MIEGPCLGERVGSRVSAGGQSAFESRGQARTVDDEREVNARLPPQAQDALQATLIEEMGTQDGQAGDGQTTRPRSSGLPQWRAASRETPWDVGRLAQSEQ